MRTQLTSQFPEHWSKDFVEHLRTVHFALVTVSVGLILILSSKPYDARDAARQMTEIMKISDALYENPDSIGRFEVNPRPFLDSPVSLEATPDRVAVQSDNTLAKKTFKFYLGRNLFVCPKLGPDPQQANRDEFLRVRVDDQAYRQRFPNTVRTFGTWWDDLLSKGVSFDSITDIEHQGTIYTKAGRYLGGLRTNISSGSDSSKSTTLRLYNECGSDARLELEGHDEVYLFSFPIAGVRRVLVDQQSVQDRFSDITIKAPGSFDDAFADLAMAARGREEMDFAILAPQIYSEVSRGDEAFDAFGIKVPSAQVSRWGMVLLVGVQLYLVMYLRRLSNKLRADDPGWDVPWMAMDESLLARIMLFGSFVVLPAYADCLLVPIHGPLLGWERNEPELFMILRLIGFCFGLALCVLSWKYRPRLSEPAAHAQLFE